MALCVQMGSSQKSKYQKWYDGLVYSRRSRFIMSPYTEVHHILPRSMGGGDEDANLVRLTFREHFIAHWLLVKICTGRDLRKMQRALFAMTMQANGTRIVAGWQLEVAKRALYTEDMIARVGARMRAEHIKRNCGAVLEARQARLAAAKEAFKLAGVDLAQPLPNPVIPIAEKRRRTRRSRKSRPGKRIREIIRAQRAEEVSNQTNSSRA